MTDYIEFKIPCEGELKDILVAELAELNYEGFIDDDEGLNVYIPQDIYQENNFHSVLNQYKISITDVKKSIIAQQNWNALWESGFQPITIDTRVIVRAPFHEAPTQFDYDLMIQPKMSFGTGHHETTRLMMMQMLDIDFSGKTVFDYGCGTGILAILAERLKASALFAIDIDEWAYENIAENIELNQCEKIIYERGDLNQAKGKKFDLILANINKNVLLASFQYFPALLNPEGFVLISGFYTQDVDDLLREAQHFDFHLQTTTEENNWASLLLVHKTSLKTNKLFH